MNKILIANWKMNPATEDAARKLAKSCDKKGVVLCPPFDFLSAVKSVTKKAKLGAQDVFWENPPHGGAYTGEISVSMLKDAGVEYVIIGHSERRKYLAETDEMINKKIHVALHAGLKVILCVGESAAIRKKGLSMAKAFIKTQLTQGLKNVSRLGVKTKNLIVAYEPIWAIGTGKADDPAEAAEIADFIKKSLKSISHNSTPIIYGGSVTSANVSRIMQYKEIAGALVGGASLISKEFNKIIKTTFAK